MSLPPPIPAPPAEPANPERDAPPKGLGATFLNAAVALACLVPLRVASAAAWFVAWVWWWGVPIRKRVSVTNLRAALPHVSPRPVLTRMMHDLVLGYVEMLRFDRLHITVEGADGVAGAVIVGGHGGAWDVALLGWARAMPLSIFLRTPKSTWVQSLLARYRDANGVHRLETGADMAAAYRALSAGRNVMFVQDQRHNKGPALPFFDRPARTSLGAAVAAQKTGCPIYGAWQWREGTGRHRLVLERIVVAPTDDVHTVTTALNAFYARQIAARPHGWLWLHDRWK